MSSSWMLLLRRLLAQDVRFSQAVRIAEKPGLLRALASFLAHSGDSWFWLSGLGLLWLYGDPFWRARALAMAVGVVVTAALVLAVKFSIRRERPAGEWGKMYRSTDPHSFPSGHATRAVMLAVMALGLGPGWFGGLLLVWAPLVSLARVTMGVHYLSDVIAGALFGAGLGWLMLLFF